jgi:hypothetical protein
MSENIRRSVLSTVAISRVLPIPDGNINAKDRRHVWMYRQYFAAPPSPVASGFYDGTATHTSVGFVARGKVRIA